MCQLLFWKLCCYIRLEYPLACFSLCNLLLKENIVAYFYHFHSNCFILAINFNHYCDFKLNVCNKYNNINNNINNPLQLKQQNVLHLILFYYYHELKICPFILQYSLHSLPSLVLSFFCSCFAQGQDTTYSLNY